MRFIDPGGRTPIALAKGLRTIRQFFQTYKFSKHITDIANNTAAKRADEVAEHLINVANLDYDKVQEHSVDEAGKTKEVKQ